MKLIAGLGNPGAKYERTRHNAGFLAIDFYLKDKSPIACQSKFEAWICGLHSGGTKIFFIKPQTFMNNSGRAILDISQFYKIDPAADILILQDETDLPLGKLRLADNSSAAGHNGVQSIFDRFDTQALHRVRIGVETRESRNDLPTDAFVLQNFTDEEWKILYGEVLPKVNEEIDRFINNQS